MMLNFQNLEFENHWDDKYAIFEVNASDLS